MSKVTIQGLQGVRQVQHAIYDFSKDGGTYGAGNEIDLFTLKANTIVHDFWYEVETACVGATATLEVGVTGGDTDSIVTQSAVTNFAIDTISGNKEKGVALFESVTVDVGDTYKANKRYKVTAETILSLLIGTASLTAGKIHFYCEFSAGY